MYAANKLTELQALERTQRGRSELKTAHYCPLKVGTCGLRAAAARDDRFSRYTFLHVRACYPRTG